ncbi:conserved hypothetical protein [Theileria equi strain WA]|uniref:Coatomer subunit beta n=1 Tax=Theileria equi strain WA TaxID=1537102 RepID=L1LE86_THEEQ|nr:conserved hypothetical protein [Theileria equi strain WA]EKX73737.1 conserved hypothetical protein [Theileria equi strain WA]|eukprot:XP_004833189.1 conserved hypothetical protein [Theileria equi strain WA]
MVASAQCSDSEHLCSIYIDIDIPMDNTLASIKKKLEDNSNSKKVAALEQIILLLLRGEDVSSLLMSIIRFAVPSNHHRLKKLVHLFFQIFDMCKPDGTVRDELILVCNALRNDLCSPNEFVRGSVLRLLSKIRHLNLIQPLVPSIIDNIKHHEPYVYRNALLCLTSIAENFGSDLVLASFNHIEAFITTCDDVSGILRCYELLEVCDISMCVQYILGMENMLLNLSPVVHLAILSSFFSLSNINEQIKELMMRVFIMILENSNDNSVLFSGSDIIVRMSVTPLHVRKVAAKSLVKILLNESDLNVKLIVISKLRGLYTKSSLANDAPNVLEDHVMDLIRGLTCTNFHVTYGLLSLVLRSLNRQNVSELLSCFKREFIKIDDSSIYTVDQTSKYRIILIKAIHHTCGVYPEHSSIVYDTLLSFLSHNHVQTAIDIALFFKQLTELLPQLREITIRKLLQVLDTIPHTDVLSICFWIIGEFSAEKELASFSCNYIYDILSPFPIVSNLQAINSIDESVSQVVTPSITTTTVILEDGTYGTEILSVDANNANDNMRRVLIDKSDPLLYNSIGHSLLKMALRCNDKDIVAKIALIVGNLTQLLQSPTNLQVYSLKRLKTILTLLVGLLKDNEKYAKLSLKYIDLSKSGSKVSSVTAQHVTDFDLDISFPSIFTSTCSKDDDWIIDDAIYNEQINILNDFDIDELTLPSITTIQDKSSLDTYRNIHQFTSISDPLYVEGMSKIIGTKMYITILIENMSKELLQNVTVELSTGDNLEKLSPIPVLTLPSGGSSVIEVNFRIKCSEDDAIFGYVYFNKSKSSLQDCLPFNPMRISMYDYIVPSFISPSVFRSYWADFEWEHKIKLHPISHKPLELLYKVLEATHMTVVGHIPPSHIQNSFGSNSFNNQEYFTQYINYLSALPEIAALADDSSFFAVNLFVKTIYGEEALANLSIVRKDQDVYSGCFRIRSRTQNVALGLGDRIAIVQRAIAI